MRALTLVSNLGGAQLKSELVNVNGRDQKWSNPRRAGERRLLATELTEHERRYVTAKAMGKCTGEQSSRLILRFRVGRDGSRSSQNGDASMQH
jgi:hypothetical protein